MSEGVKGEGVQPSALSDSDSIQFLDCSYPSLIHAFTHSRTHSRVSASRGASIVLAQIFNDLAVVGQRTDIGELYIGAQFADIAHAVGNGL